MSEELLEKLTDQVVDEFLREAMLIQEQPKFMHGANESARTEKLLKLVEEYGEKI
jgi:hypothetical protein